MAGRMERKLGLYGPGGRAAVVEIRDPRRLTLPERLELLRNLRAFNFALYQCRPPALDKSGLRAFGEQLGITRTDHNHCADEDDISSVQVSGSGVRPRYIPYTDRPLGWHTDGYYYGVDAGKTIRSFVLHCVSPAPAGGDNSLLDPDVLFLLLRRIDESLPVALSAASAFAIPPDSDQPVGPAGGRDGPVFSIDPATGTLHMRYTERRRNIFWSTDEGVVDALRCLKSVIEGAAEFTVNHRLEAGQGIVCNNVLHRRSGFTDGSSGAARRLIYRARYYDRVPGTAPAGARGQRG